MRILIKNKEDFTRKFLTPIQAINSVGALITVEDNKAKTTVQSPESTCVGTFEYNIQSEGDCELPINVSSFITALNCIDRNDDIEILIKDNYLKYATEYTNFKLHLLDRSVVSIPALNVDKIKSITPHAQFVLEYDRLKQLLASASFVQQSKVYFYKQDDNVFAKLTDNAIENTDSFAVNIGRCESDFNQIAVDFDMLKMMVLFREPLTLGTNNQVLTVDLALENSYIRYILAPFKR